MEDINANPKEEHKNESPSCNEIHRLYAIQVKQLYNHLHIGIIASLVNSLILILILRKLIPQSVLISWFSAILTISFLRYLLYFKFQRSSQTPSEVVRWDMWFTASTALSGIIWGSAGIFLFPIDSIAYQIFIAFVLGGMVAGAAGTYSVLIRTFLAFSLPALFPIIIRFSFIADDIHLPMGGMVLLFLFLMFFTAKRINAVTISSLKLQFENSDLIKHLSAEKVRVEKINEDYLSEINERKQAEEALCESEEKYRNLFHNAQVGLYRTRISDGKFVETNDALARMFGYENRADMLDSEYITADNYVDSSARDTLLATLREHGEFKNFEARLYRKDRSVAWFRYSGRIYPEKGYIEGVASDITEEKRLEERLLQAQKMEAIGTLAGGVAHDLNNILSGLTSYPELLLMDIPEDSPLRKPIMTIQDSGRKAAVIVQDLLTLARRGVKITEVVNLNHIISEQLESPEFEKLISFHPDVQVKTNLEKDLLNIKGSPTHLSKSVMNILSNAAEAMPSGGTILISVENRYLDRPIKGYDHVKSGEYVTVSVTDTGLGISEKDAKRIFEPFYTKKVMGRSGTGLGMAVVWGTVKDHKGYIDIQSTIGKGTTFTLYFPVTRNEIAKDKSLLPILDYMGKGEQILVVDDVEAQREIATGMLRKLGYSVISVSRGEEAVEYLKTNSADLIVLDMLMEPGINGRETYEKIIKYHPNQKAIIASGFSETDDVKIAQKLGAGEYIKKPYTLEKIGIAVRDELKE